MRAYERLLNYVTVHTQSDPESTTVPTTSCQFDLAHKLVAEMKELGIEDARVDDKCYVYGTLPATAGCENKKKIGFIAHMDTAPDFNGEGVKPQVIENYDGGDVVLGNSGKVLTVENFPHLIGLKGRTLITTDGRTLLGSDDKSGIAEILTAVEIIQRDKLPHGTICIGFTPDEEVGAGADYFDVEAFGADYAYTLDGGEEGEIVYENFNASEANFTVHGFNVHPGSAKNTMINAQLVAMEINGLLPGCETPAQTEGYEGFFHLCEMEGNVERATLQYIVRDHDMGTFRRREDMLRHIVKVLNEKYGEGTVELSIREQYLNMKEKVEECFEVVEKAEAAIKELGIEPITLPERGGTDGARLSFMGLPCPNLGTGGYAFHGPYEHVTAEGMDKAVEVILGIIKA
ncbi:peptidase T [Acetivibrio ethanolgignens]|uniref:Peptidase T n=1 Tax=Acetivibrio ethanolgignens TaxID=290052 RepID=A0A0V8QEK1_9FIRM|nr:peptidase T [Acetivibrio ethanolgignens]KSV58980.1 peptidase T [Acetivibrio ethanolgignens]